MASKTKECGIGIATKRIKKRLYIEITMVGKLTHEDYAIFVPVIDRALKGIKELEVDLLVDMRMFKGWEMLAVWDDLKFGIKHRNSFDKIAIIGDKRWEEVSVNLMKHLMSGKAKFFKKPEKAKEWLLK